VLTADSPALAEAGCTGTGEALTGSSAGSASCDTGTGQPQPGQEAARLEIAS
jgi:hypothetical protein